MEIVIMICLLLILILLLQDKISITVNRSQREHVQEKVNPDLPDIMGQPKPIPRPSVLNNATERQAAESVVDIDSLDIEYDPNEIVGIQIPNEELDEVFGTLPDPDEGEDPWIEDDAPVDDLGFAQGVTFEELAKVGKMLKEEKLEQAQKSEAVEIVRKIQGTELFYLLEQSIDGASTKIARLLDSTLAGTDSGSSILRDDDLKDFDIGEFV